MVATYQGPVCRDPFAKIMMIISQIVRKQNLGWRVAVGVNQLAKLVSQTRVAPELAGS